jgi:hypothetical protein
MRLSTNDCNGSGISVEPEESAVESVFATVKLEAVRGQVFVSRAVAYQEPFDCIEDFYNHQRLHSGIRYALPSVMVPEGSLLD